MFCFDLPSVSKLTKDQNRPLTFLPDYCVKQDFSSMKPIGMHRVQNGLYYLESVTEEKALMGRNSKNADIWHRRLGHSPISQMSSVDGLSVDVKNNWFCDA